MDFDKQHLVWKQQLKKLVDSKTHLMNTGRNNILSNFFSQAIENEFQTESDSFRTRIKALLNKASTIASDLEGTCRERAVQVLPFDEPIFCEINLNDIRNMILFEIYKRCGVVLDSYFERYSSPPGTTEQNQIYLSIAHGNAKCTAIWTEKLRFTVTALVLLKRFFLVYDVFQGKQLELDQTNLNWFGTSWIGHIANKNLADLIWNIFLDLWTYEKLQHF